jgi:DNA repair protein RecO (recombination protein O)
MSSINKTQGIVIKKKELLNLDILITLLTKDFGKINILAKGIKKINSRRAPHIQTGNFINVIVSSKAEFYYLQESVLISGFSEIKKSSKKISLLYYLFSILDKLMPEAEKEEDVFRITLHFLINLSKIKNYDEKFIEKYLNLILKKLGYIRNSKKLNDLHKLIEDILNEKIPFFVI